MDASRSEMAISMTDVMYDRQNKASINPVDARNVGFVNDHDLLPIVLLGELGMHWLTLLDTK